MPKPDQAVGQTSLLRSRLGDPERRAETIAAVAKVYAEEGDLDRAAQRFGARRRTLERLLVDYPDLRDAIAEARNRIGVL